MIEFDEYVHMVASVFPGSSVGIPEGGSVLVEVEASPVLRAFTRPLVLASLGDYRQIDPQVWEGMSNTDLRWLVIGGEAWHLRTWGIWRLLDSEGGFITSCEPGWPATDWEPVCATPKHLRIVPAGQVVDLTMTFDDGRCLEVFSRSPLLSWRFDAAPVPDDSFFAGRTAL